MYFFFWYFLFSCGFAWDNPILLVFKENTKTSIYNDLGYWARNYLPNCNHLNHSPDVPRPPVPRYVKFSGAENTSCPVSDRNTTAEALLKTHFQSNSKAWSTVTFLALGGTNAISLIIACFGVTSLSMKLKNRVCCVVSIGLTIKLRKSSVVGEWNIPPSWVIMLSAVFLSYAILFHLKVAVSKSHWKWHDWKIVSLTSALPMMMLNMQSVPVKRFLFFMC